MATDTSRINAVTGKNSMQSLWLDGTVGSSVVRAAGCGRNTRFHVSSHALSGAPCIGHPGDMRTYSSHRPQLQGFRSLLYIRTHFCDVDVVCVGQSAVPGFHGLRAEILGAVVPRLLDLHVV